MKQLPAGAIAPDFELETLDGTPFRLSDASREAPLVLAFFKIACPTCQFTLPYLSRIRKVGTGAVRILGVSQDDAAETKDFLRRFQVDLETVLDPHPYVASMLFALEYVPGIFVIGTDGVIQISDFGFSKQSLEQIAELTGRHSGLGPPVLFSAADGVPASRPG